MAEGIGAVGRAARSIHLSNPRTPQLADAAGELLLYYVSQANWFFIALLVVSVVVLALRIPKEKQMLIEVFGDEYKAYMQRTEGLFAK